MSSGIYAIVNTVSKRMYVGQSVNMPRRWLSHWKSAREGVKTPLYDAMRAYGKGVFEMLPIEHCERYELNASETKWINLLGTMIPNGYNLIDGGTQDQRALSEETRKRMADAQRGKKHTAEHKAKIAAAGMGRTATGETRARLSASLKGLKRTPEQCARIAIALRGRVPHNKGKTGYIRSEESKAKQSAATRGVPKSPEHSAKLLAGLARGRATAAARKKGSM